MWLSKKSVFIGAQCFHKRSNLLSISGKNKKKYKLINMVTNKERMGVGH
jgi:hypothetical protein